MLNQYVVGDAFVRELEMSQITLRLVDKSSEKNETHVLAKLTGQTLTTLQRCLVGIRISLCWLS